MDNHVSYSRNLLTRFIQLYKESPCLWNKHCPSYKHKSKRNDAITKLTTLVQESDPDATCIHVLRKIESLRACVRRETKKVNDSRRRAKKSEEIYTPSLWYYPLFSFLESEQTLKTMKKEYEEIELSENSDMEEYQYDEPSYSNQDCETPSTSMVEVNVEPPRVRDAQEESRKRSRVEVDDEYDAVGLIVASKLRGLQPNMRLIAEKLINDVLYQAQINGLHSSSIIVTPDPFK